METTIEGLGYWDAMAIILPACRVQGSKSVSSGKIFLDHSTPVLGIFSPGAAGAAVEAEPRHSSNDLLSKLLRGGYI